MTSEEIKNLKRGFGDVMDWTEDREQFAHRQIDGIWEIAYQLARLVEQGDKLAEANETKRREGSEGRCPKCGRPWWSHSPQECREVPV